MSSMQPEKSFEFVTQEPSSGGFSAETKTRIRKQAMKAVSAARRKSGRHGQHNLLQYPPDMESDNDSTKIQGPSRSRDSTSRDRSTIRKGARDRASPSPARIMMGIPVSVPYAGMERVLREHKIDPANLETLTTFQVASMVLEMDRLGVCEKSSIPFGHFQSYLPHAYLRYGSSKCLDDALLCLLYKSQQQSYPPESQNTNKMISLFNHALGSLTAALGDETLLKTPEVLCTAEVLALYESLGDPQIQSWRPHISGAFHLLQLRGPHSYTTEFEKTLFMSIMARSLCSAFRANQKCWVEDESWQKTFNEILSPMHTTFTALALLPTLSNEVTEIVFRNRGIAEHERMRLVIRIKKVMADLASWHHELGATTLPVEDNTATGYRYPETSDYRGNAMVGVMILSRMLGAILFEERDTLESQTVAQAQEILGAWEKAKAIGSDYGFTERVVLAQGITETTRAWRRESCSGGLIGTEIFAFWCKSMGRSTD